MANPSYQALAENLGFKPGDSIYVETTPDWYTRFADENRLELEPGLPATHAHIFCATKAELAGFLRENDLPQIEKSLWISWPKTSGKNRAGLSQGDIRSAVLPLGWADAKAVDIDTDWSGLQFIRREP